MMIESDFYATDAGRKHFADQLTSIRYCVQETCNFDVLFSLLVCGNYDFRYDQAKGLRPRRVIKTAMQHELMMFGITQKDGLGMDRAVEEVKYRMCAPPQGRRVPTRALTRVPARALTASPARAGRGTG